MRMAHGAPIPVQMRQQSKKSGMHDKSKTRNDTGKMGTGFNEQTIRVSKRFYVALMLSRLVQVTYFSPCYVLFLRVKMYGRLI